MALSSTYFPNIDRDEDFYYSGEPLFHVVNCLSRDGKDYSYLIYCFPLRESLINEPFAQTLAL